MGRRPSYVPIDEVQVIDRSRDPFSATVADDALDVLNRAVSWEEIAQLDAYAMQFSSTSRGRVTMTVRLLHPDATAIAIALGAYGKALKLSVHAPVFDHRAAAAHAVAPDAAPRP